MYMKFNKATPNPGMVTLLIVMIGSPQVNFNLGQFFSNQDILLFLSKQTVLLIHHQVYVYTINSLKKACRLSLDASSSRHVMNTTYSCESS